MYSEWHAPKSSGGTSSEACLSFDHGREHRLLILPPLFDEHNKFRRQAVEIMRRLDTQGIDTFLPDLPGCNESLSPLRDQSLASWRTAAEAAAAHFSATQVLAIRGGALLAPATLFCWSYAPSKGRQILRAMIRARTIAAREAGREEKADALLAEGRAQGLELAGWTLGAEMIAQLEQAEPATGKNTRLIEQVELGGSPLWLRAEPDDDPAQADALAALVADGMTAG